MTEKSLCDFWSGRTIKVRWIERTLNVRWSKKCLAFFRTQNPLWILLSKNPKRIFLKFFTKKFRKMMHDLINDAISSIKNSERIGKAECVVRPVSKLLIEILGVFQKENYIGEFEYSDDNRGGSIKIKLTKNINDCGVIKPRFQVKHYEFTKWEKRFLPSRDFGLLVMSTSKGVMSHRDANKMGIGGKLLAYIY